MSTQKLGCEIPSSIIHNSQKVETTQTPVNWWMAKQNVDGILFSSEKEQSGDACYDVVESWKHCAEWNKPDTEDPIL